MNKARALLEPILLWRVSWSSAKLTCDQSALDGANSVKEKAKPDITEDGWRPCSCSKEGKLLTL